MKPQNFPDSIAHPCSHADKRQPFLMRDALAKWEASRGVLSSQPRCIRIKWPGRVMLPSLIGPSLMNGARGQGGGALGREWETHLFAICT